MAEKQKSAGAIIYFIDNNEKSIKFLLLKYKTYWGFAKGIIEKNNGKDETTEETVRREVAEETGLQNVEIVPKFKYVQRWFFRAEGKIVSKEAIFFLVKVTKADVNKVKISFEHEDFKWLSYDEALKFMKIKNNKEMLKEAHEFIKKHEKGEKQKRLF